MKKRRKTPNGKCVRAVLRVLVYCTIYNSFICEKRLLTYFSNNIAFKLTYLKVYSDKDFVIFHTMWCEYLLEVGDGKIYEEL